MGITITLDVFAEAIEPEAWAAVYDETLAFLTNCPQAILGLRGQQVGKVRRLFFSPRLEHDRDRPERRHWVANGDAVSKARGSSFIVTSGATVTPGRRQWAGSTSLTPALTIPVWRPALFSEVDLVAAFRDRFPDQCETIRAAVEARTSAARRELAKISTILTDLGSSGDLSPGEDLLLVKTFDGLADSDQKALAEAGKQLRQLYQPFMKEMRAFLDGGTWQNVREFASTLATKRNLVLTEATWNHLDDERNRDELDVVLILLSLQGDSKKFCDFRFAAIENAAIRQHLARTLGSKPSEDADHSGGEKASDRTADPVRNAGDAEEGPDGI